MHSAQESECLLIPAVYLFAAQRQGSGNHSQHFIAAIVQDNPVRQHTSHSQIWLSNNKDST